mgnify:CR=1 FL=1
MPRVLITPVQFSDPDAAYFRSLPEAGMELVFPKDQRYTGDPAALARELAGIDAAIASTEPYTAEVLGASNLRVVARTGVGYDSIDVPAATANKTLVTITPGAVDVSVAETTLALIFAVYRDVVARDREARSGVWKRQAMPRLAGKTLGIVGLGRIGKTVARLAKGVHLQVIAHDPFADETAATEASVQLMDVDDLLRAADIVSLHTPCTPETANFIRQETLAMMKADAVLINTGRGGLVNEDDLYRAMCDGHLLGAALDVFHQEPTPTDNPLLSLPNVVAAPHTAGLDHQSQIDMPRIAAECVARLYRGDWPEGCVINASLRDTWTWDR